MLPYPPPKFVNVEIPGTFGGYVTLPVLRSKLMPDGHTWEVLVYYKTTGQTDYYYVN